MKRQNLRTVSLIIVTFTYLLIGAAIFGYLESDYERVQKDNLHIIEDMFKRRYNINDEDLSVLSTTLLRSMSHKAGRQWQFPGAFYFATTVVTTIGYGHSTPSTMGGRCFCMIYALIGIPLGLVMFQSIGERLNTIVGMSLKRIKRFFRAKNPEVTQTNLVAVVSVLSTILMTSMAAVFASYERWDYFDALYYCFITLTTIGFGDYVALQKDSALQEKPEYVVLSLVFILFGLSVVSSAVNLLVLKFLTLNTEDERRDEQLRYTANLNPILLEGDVITPAGQQHHHHDLHHHGTAAAADEGSRELGEQGLASPEWSGARLIKQRQARKSGREEDRAGPDDKGRFDRRQDNNNNNNSNNRDTGADKRSESVGHNEAWHDVYDGVHDCHHTCHGRTRALELLPRSCGGGAKSSPSSASSSQPSSASSSSSSCSSSSWHDGGKCSTSSRLRTNKRLHRHCRNQEHSRCRHREAACDTNHHRRSYLNDGTCTAVGDPAALNCSPRQELCWSCRGNGLNAAEPLAISTRAVQQQQQVGASRIAGSQSRMQRPNHRQQVRQPQAAGAVAADEGFLVQDAARGGARRPLLFADSLSASASSLCSSLTLTRLARPSERWRQPVPALPPPSQTSAAAFHLAAPLSRSEQEAAPSGAGLRPPQTKSSSSAAAASSSWLSLASLAAFPSPAASAMSLASAGGGARSSGYTPRRRLGAAEPNLAEPEAGATPTAPRRPRKPSEAPALRDSTMELSLIGGAGDDAADKARASKRPARSAGPSNQQLLTMCKCCCRHPECIQHALAASNMMIATGEGQFGEAKRIATGATDKIHFQVGAANRRAPRRQPASSSRLLASSSSAGHLAAMGARCNAAGRGGGLASAGRRSKSSSNCSAGKQKLEAGARLLQEAPSPDNSEITEIFSIQRNSLKFSGSQRNE